MKRIIAIMIVLVAMFASAAATFAADAATAPKVGQFGVDVSANYLVGTEKAWESGLRADFFLPVEDMGGFGVQGLLNGKLRDNVLGLQHDFLLLGLGVGYNPKPLTKEDSWQPTFGLLYGGEEIGIDGVSNSVSGPIVRVGLTGYGVAQNNAGGWLAKKMLDIQAMVFVPSGEDAQISASADWYFRSFNKTGAKVGVVYEKDDADMGSVFGGNICATVKFQTAQICAEARSRSGATNPDDDGMAYGISASIFFR